MTTTTDTPAAEAGDARFPLPMAAVQRRAKRFTLTVTLPDGGALARTLDLAKPGSRDRHAAAIVKEVADLAAVAADADRWAAALALTPAEVRDELDRLADRETADPAPPAEEPTVEEPTAEEPPDEDSRGDDSPEGELTLEATPGGRRGAPAEVTARVNGDAVHADRLHLSDAKARRRFAAAVADSCPALDAGDVAAELLALHGDGAADLPADAEARSAAGGEPAELDPARVVRPDLFITPAACGIVIPRVLETEDGPVGVNTLLLILPDGTREARTVKIADRGRVALPDAQPLYLHPRPTPPAPGEARELCGWSRAGRTAWLAGAPSPCPAKVLRRVRAKFAAHLAVPDDDAPGVLLTLASWTVATYVRPAFAAVGYLHLTGPANSGKTRAFSILARLTFRPLQSSNLTAPALFRTLHARGGTLLLDEAERLGNPRDPAAEELTGMLLAGYKRGGSATRLEPVDEGFRSVSFDVFGFKALAGIASLPGPLAGRCVPVAMRRADAGDARAAADIEAGLDGWTGLRDDLHAFAVTYGPAVKAAAADPSAGLSNRDREVWGPMLAIAAVADAAGFGGAVETLADHAGRVSAEVRDESAPEEDGVLLTELHRLLADHSPQPKEVREAAKRAEPALFERWTAKRVGSRLRRYGLIARKVNGRLIYADATRLGVIAAARRYGIDLEADDGGDLSSPEPPASGDADAPADPWDDPDGGRFDDRPASRRRPSRERPPNRPQAPHVPGATASEPVADGARARRGTSGTSGQVPGGRPPDSPPSPPRPP